MRWTRPAYQALSLGMEVTAYVNTDDRVGPTIPPQPEPPTPGPRPRSSRTFAERPARRAG
jgi:coenzyme PQQ precursor peptide PqqA